MSGLETSSSTWVISADRLVHAYGRIPALEDVSLNVAAGEMFGLVGPDGAGKTTTIRILAGMIAPQSGKALILGADPLSGSTALRSSLGYMPQQYSLYGDLTVDENLRFFSRMFHLGKNDYRDRRARLLRITRLEPFIDRRADALSGGMYKKLALACALLPRPSVLLMDEPTNGVDPVSRRELWAMLFEFAAEGMAILVSTPYMDEATRCHRVGLMHRGKIILQGKPEDLLRDFPQATFALVGGDRGLSEEILARHPSVIAVSTMGASLRIVAKKDQYKTLERELCTTGARLVSAQPDFEDLFLATTSGGSHE
jgi:ABC-2 type transport system ATP-binding protein